MIDVSQFVAPENKWEGLHDLSDKVLKIDALKTESNNAAIAAKEKQAANSLAATKYINELYDPKNVNAGTIHSNRVTLGMDNLRTKALDLLGKGGMDVSMIQQILSKEAQGLSGQYEKEKLIKSQIDDRLKDLPKGYDVGKLREKSYQEAFMDDKGLPKELGDDVQDYVGIAARKYANEVTNNEGLINHIKLLGQNDKPRKISKKVWNSRGGYTSKDIETNAPYYMVFKKDAKGNDTDELVPDYEIAVDDKKSITHPFTDAKGKVSNAEVFLVKDKLFKDMLKDNPAYADRLAWEVEQHIKSGEYLDAKGKPITLDSEQANTLAKALMWNDLNDLSPKGYKEDKENKPTQIRNVTNINNGKGGSGEITINDVFGGIKTKVDASADKGAVTPMVNLTSDEQNAVLNEINKNAGDTKYTYEDVALVKDGDNIVVYKADNGAVQLKPSNVITTLTAKGVNIKNQAGVKEKRSVIQKAKDMITGKQKQKTFDVVDPQGNIVMQGVDEATANKAKAKGYKIK